MKDPRLSQHSRIVYAPPSHSHQNNCCNYKSNYDPRKKGHRCRVCGGVYAKLPAKPPS